MPATLEAFLQRRPYNAVTDFVDANVDRGLADRIAFTDGGRSITYGELREGTFRVAAALRTLGLRQENRVVLILHDSVDYPVAFWGALRAGIVAIPVNTLLTAEQYRYLLADSRAAAAVVAAGAAAAGAVVGAAAGGAGALHATVANTRSPTLVRSVKQEAAETD